MKELTIEQNAKAYDEALDRAKKWYNAPNIDKIPTYGNRIVEEIFPELKESEDERIRKELINYLITDEDNGVPKVGQIPIDNVITWLEKQNPIMAKSPQLGEQKSANNNELKFKVGDWVVENGVNGNPVQITSFEEDKGVGIKVWFSNGTGTWVDYLKGYHKWTIEDARDGDVLADNLGVILFKSIRDNNVINYYAYLSGIFSVQKDEEYWGYAVNCTLSPATKEQRERFFAAMHDAGYEWDAEKKELKKIEQKPDEWSKEDNIRLQRIIDFLWYNRKGDTDDIYQQEQDINWLKSFKDRVQPQSKQEWSVEDKSKVQRICKYLDEAKKYYADITEVRECMDWLKSLKQKIVTK